MILIKQRHWQEINSQSLFLDANFELAAKFCFLATPEDPDCFLKKRIPTVTTKRITILKRGNINIMKGRTGLTLGI